MFQVVIIDDEPIIRKGIRNVIHWQEFGCEVGGEADDGQSGRELIEKIHPDIIITDIKMPEVDGLMMIGRVREIVPDSKIIILTGYRNFDYARTAVKLGAFDYLMKPTKIDELSAVIRRAVEELRSKTARRDELGRLREQYEKSKPLVRERLLYNLLYGFYSNGEEAAREAERLNLRTDRYVLGLVENEAPRADAEPEGKDEAHLYQFGILSTLEEALSERFRVAGISLGSRLSAFLLAPKGDEELDNTVISEKCLYLQQMIHNCFGFTVSIAVSSQGSGTGELPGKLHECQEALEHKFYLGNNSIIFYHDLDTFFQYSDCTFLLERQKQLLDNIKAGNVHAIAENTAAIFECINGLTGIGKDYVRNFYFNTITMIHSMKISLPIDTLRKQNDGPLVSLYGLIEKCDSVADLNGLLENIAMSVADKVRDYNDNNMKLLMRKAVDYINAHYSEDVTLNQVAEHIYVSSFYISRMFKKELGINFVDYLNELRINKAKELLSDARYKTYEVAEAVGISNAHYFSKLFRKYAGMTASEYRESLST